MAHPAINSFDAHHSLDFFKALCKKKIGSGAFREVWEWDPNPEWVVKFETSGEEFQNIIEFKVWEAAPRWLAHWLAPCIRISPFGTVLWQVYCDPIPKHRLPKKIPVVLNDWHDLNWGLYKNRPVLFDYGFLYNIVRNTSDEMKEVDYEKSRTVKKKEGAA